MLMKPSKHQYEWQELKIDHFDPITVSKVRLRVTRSASEPLIRKFAVYNTRRPAVPGSKP